MPEPEETEDRAPARPGQSRLFAAIARPSRRQAVVAVLLGLLGFMAVTQVSVTANENDYSALRQQELVDVLDGLAGARQRAQGEIDRLESTREELRSSTNQRQAAIDAAREEIDNLTMLAGLVPVTGPGIRATITEEGEGRVDVGSLIDVIQELRTNDAEAIQVNGTVRVVADTAITDAPGGFELDGQLVEPPYIIEAIGEPSALAGALDTRVGAGIGLVDDGAQVEVAELNSLDITAVQEPEESRWAEPAEGQ
ncbi:DUF881 domain-containing protein [Nocardioides panacisoli]|uniref:DUF881 domain-containing protein n=1 Tax=Nocardioides panacisoli TaxID=627624 RepID=UPI001C63A495|nr:DUF881 domain-containing protein [Nocardioides panacisoli]QYJ05119.1 DUF881 domain-containing protein [Nocardioides panacisoli]